MLARLGGVDGDAELLHEGAEQGGDDTSDEGAGHAETERAEESEALATGLEEPRERADDQADDEESEELHVLDATSRSGAGTSPGR